ncbi:MAG: type II toxin-antitoxin system VapC family toxin [Oscillibacter sp.]|nr:type II toxin-antitoxin system VapC family toxin [Oscillibacter sp.]
MRLLLDTHILLWTLLDAAALSKAARDKINTERNEIFYSIASVWEVAIKHRARPDKMLTDARTFSMLCKNSGYLLLPVTEQHVFMLDALQRRENAPSHKDPFDRILIAQAKAENMLFLTHDTLLPDYEEPCIIMV